MSISIDKLILQTINIINEMKGTIKVDELAGNEASSGNLKHRLAYHQRNLL